MDQVDITIIGAGVVGLAIAQKLASDKRSIILLERNTSFGEETSSRNSEVIHAGIYYPKESLKARFCVAGRKMLYDYCRKNQIPHQPIGKLIVATCAAEEPALEEIFAKAKENGVDDLQWLAQEKVKIMEPNLRATTALFSPSTGIIDSHALMRCLLSQGESQGLLFAANSEAKSIIPEGNGFIVQAKDGRENFTFRSHCVINAAGLQAQNVASQIEGLDESTIPPGYLCKGNYFSIQGKAPFSHLIYPVPEANGVGLGIHATLDLAGQVKFGPDTEYVDHIDYRESIQNLPKYYQAIRRYFPTLPEDSLAPAYAGIRPKIQAPGAPFQDFVIQTEATHQIPGLIQLFGIESPGLTSCLAIADYVEHLLPA